MAIKRLKSEHVQRITREAHAIAALNHPASVPFTTSARTTSSWSLSTESLSKVRCRSTKSSHTLVRSATPSTPRTAKVLSTAT